MRLQLNNLPSQFELSVFYRHRDTFVLSRIVHFFSFHAKQKQLRKYVARSKILFIDLLNACVTVYKEHIHWLNFTVELIYSNGQYCNFTPVKSNRMTNVSIAQSLENSCTYCICKYMHKRYQLWPGAR